MGSDGLETKQFEYGIGEYISENTGLAEPFLNNSESSEHNQASSEILFITSYPPRECGIATYSKNLIQSLNNRFNNYFNLKVCALERGNAKYYYPQEVTDILNTLQPSEYYRVADEINHNTTIKAVIVQHEFDLFKYQQKSFIRFLNEIEKPLGVVFHTVIPQPSKELRKYIQNISSVAGSIVVMAQSSASVLISEYHLPKEKLEVIPYGTHLVAPVNASLVREKYKLTGRKVLTTFGLLNPGKGIETTLEALPAVIKIHPEVMFLVIGKTHPEELKQDGEQYRIMLESRVKSLKLQNHVQFLNGFFASDILEEYLSVTDICIFSCSDTNRAVSNTFSFAVSCGCPIISTATAHASEFLGTDAGLTFDNRNPDELAIKITHLLDDPSLRKNFSENLLNKSLSAIWENSALSYKAIIDKISDNQEPVELKFPALKLDFLKLLTDRTGIINLSYKGEPDIRSGYTLDDNAFALFVFCMHFRNNGDVNDISYIKKYLRFIYHCYQPSGTFYKYLDYQRKFSDKNYHENLEESQAKTIWALGYTVSMKGLLPTETLEIASLILQNVMPRIVTFESAKSIAFAIKGLYYYYSVAEEAEILTQIKSLANKLVKMYENISGNEWHWFEDKFSVLASVIPGALLNTWLLTDDVVYRKIAKESFSFLASRTFNGNRIETISENDWDTHKETEGKPGELPCDIAFNVLTCSKFYLICKESQYFNKMDTAFNWFLGNNRLKQMVYNPVLGSCFNGLENNRVNFGQSAESALSYTLARMVVEKYKFKGENHIII